MTGWTLITDRNGRNRAALSLGTLALVASLAVGLPSAALADELPFQPSLSVSADDAAAGAHPNLTVQLTRPANYCAVPWIDEDRFCPAEDTVPQQDLKKLVLTMPDGLAPDPNAAPPCTPVNRLEVFPEHITKSAFYCPPETQIGTLVASNSGCWVSHPGQDPIQCPDVFSYEEDGSPIYFTGNVYMGVRREGEQAHLIILGGLGQWPDEALIDVSVKVGPNGKITATSDNITDYEGVEDIGGTLTFRVGVQLHEVNLTLDGATGVETGHPLLTNPTSCSQKQVTGEAQGYAFNLVGLEPVEQGTHIVEPGHGDGTTVPISDRYYVTGCNQIPYAPQMSMTLDPPTPGANPAITSTITQASGEQNSDSVSVKFAKSFKINVQTKAAQCADGQFNSGSCPADSNIGTATAQSPLLPIDSAPLSGPVYLGQTDLAAGNIKLMTKLANDFLPNGITITGTSQLNADGTLQANFNDVPDLPISSFTLALEGGDKGLVKNPKTCGPKTVEGTFTSHQGKQVASSPQVAIACDEASLQVDASTRRAKAHPTISLTASAASMRSLSFKLPSALRVARHSEQGKGYGTLTFLTEDGTTETKLDLLGSGKKKFSFSAVRAGHQVTAVTLRKKKANLVTLSNVPDGTISATLDLEGQKNNFLANPSSCRALQRTAKGKRRATGKRKDLNYSATVTNVEGKTMTPVLRTAMACGKRKAKKRR